MPPCRRAQGQKNIILQVQRDGRGLPAAVLLHHGDGAGHLRGGGAVRGGQQGGGKVEMADEQDSDSCVGYHVWVQVPFSALINIFKGVIRLIPITPFLHFIFTIVIKTCNTGYYNCYPNL